MFFEDMFPGMFDSLYGFLVFLDFGGSDFIVREPRVDCTQPPVVYFVCGMLAFLDYSLTS